MMKTLFGVLIFIIVGVAARGQVVINTLNTGYSENFDGLGNSAIANLPSGYKISSGNNYATADVTLTSFAEGTSGAATLTVSSNGGIYNFANGVTASSTDRSFGFLSSGAFSSPRSIMLQVTNSTGFPITSFSIAFDYEKYRSGSRSFDWTFFHGLDGVNWTSESGGNENFAADLNNSTVFDPPASRNKSITIGGINIPSGSSYYFRWTYTGVGGSTNGQAIGIDNFSITAFTGSVTPSNPTDHFRTKQSGDWGAASTWESSSDGLNWINATLIPNSNANTISIISGHTVNMVSAVSADQLIIQAGGVLNHSHTITFTLNDGVDDDMIINGTYVLNGAIPSGTGNYAVNYGGVIRVDANTGGNADDLAFSSNTRVLFRTGSVFQWNTNVIFETVGINYFRIDASETEKPIFRISANNLNVGSNSPTTINGLLDITGSVLWTGTGAKIFRDGITGIGNITQTEAGVFRITGLSAVVGITDPSKSITLTSSGGLEIVSGSQTELIASTKIDGASFTNNGVFNCQSYIVSGSTAFVNATGASLGIGSADGITAGTTSAGNIQTTGGRTFNSSATYVYNGTTNQVTGNGLPIAVQVLSISSFGTSGNNTVTLTTTNTTAERFNLNKGYFVAGINGNLNIEVGGAIFGAGGFQPNDPISGTITFKGSGKTEGTLTGYPHLYAVIINGGVNFNGDMLTESATILNRLQINSGAFVQANAPYYAAGSTLIYNTNGVYGRNIEWGNLTGLQGYPHHVIVQGNTILDLFTNPVNPAQLEIGGNLIIGNANGRGEVYMNDYMNKPLSVKGNLVIGSNEAASAGSRLWLSEATFGDLWLEGSFTRQANSFYNDNGRSLHLKGTTSSSINTPGVVTPGVISQEFSQIRLEKTGLPAPVITLNCTVGINNEITFTGGVINTTNEYILIVKNAAISDGGNTSSFVNGPLRKIGNYPFTFHIGKIVGSEYQYRKIGISAPDNSNDAFTAEFRRANARLLGEPVSPLQRVSQCEYWSLDHINAGTETSVNVTLSWTEQSPCNVSYVTDLPTLAVAKLNGSLWNSLGNGMTSGVEANGTITAATTTTVGSDFFTLASTDLSQNPLPFALSSFTARSRKTDIAVDWMLTNNNDYDEFILERSKDGVRFETLKVVKAKVILNTAAYIEEDGAPFNGWNYYRLRAINKIGKESISQIVKVWFGREDVIRISPNPASEKILINFAEPGTISQIDLINTSGQVLQRIQTINFNTEINISHLHAGMYFLRITGKNGPVTKSFIKQ